MNDFLTEIMARKQFELTQRRSCRPSLRPPRDAVDPTRDFRAALNGGGIIAEIKRRSPTVNFFPNAADPVALAGVYRAAGAAAISIVTDEMTFGMRLADIRPVREASGLPILVKDFIIDEYQIDEARAAGADAILLIARIVDKQTLARLATHAHSLGLAALIECHDQADLLKATRIDASLIGINNRNLSTLEVSLETTRRLLEHVPADALLVCESGIDEVDTITELSRLGVDAFLVGGALLTADDPGSCLRRMTAAAGHGHAGERTDHA